MPPVVVPDELELLEDELELLLEEEPELLELEVGPPLQFPADGLLPLTTMVSMLGKPALFDAFRLNRLFPACSVTVAVVEFVQLVHPPVPANA